jgi:hypothetical protein
MATIVFGTMRKRIAVIAGAFMAALTAIARSARLAPRHPSWIVMKRDQRAFLDEDGYVCTSASEWFKGVRYNTACERWRPGTRIHVVDWSRQSWNPKVPWVKLTFVRVRDDAGRLGVLPCVGLIPVVPRGTPVLIVEPDPAAVPGSRPPKAVVLEQLLAEGGRGLKLRTSKGAERLVRIRDVADMRGNPIGSLRDPYGRYY